MVLRTVRADRDTDPDIADIAALEPSDGSMLYWASGGTRYNTTASTPYMRGLLNTASEAALKAAINAEAGVDFVAYNGALGTPSSGVLTNATGLPISTGVAGLGTGVATALAVNVGSAGAPVVNGGALGTPSSGTLTNATGLPVATGISGLGTGQAAHLANAVPAVYVADRTGATAQAKINDADDNGTAGLALILEKTAAPTAEPDALSLGRSVGGAPGGSTYTPVSSSSFRLLRAIGSGDESTYSISGAHAAGLDYLTLNTVAGLSRGQWIEILVLNSGVYSNFATTINAVVASTSRIYLNDKLEFAITSGPSNVDYFAVMTDPYSDAEFRDISAQGDSLTGVIARALYIEKAKDVRVGNIFGEDFNTGSPRTANQLANVLYGFQLYGCSFGTVKARRSGTTEGASIQLSRLFKCTVDALIAEDAYNFGINISGGCNSHVRTIKVTGSSGRGFKVESFSGIRIDYAETNCASASGAAFLAGTKASVGLLKATRQRPAVDIVSITVASNVATIVTDRPHNLAAGVSITIAGSSDGNCNGTFSVAGVSGAQLTSTTFTVAITTSDGAKGGTPVFTYNNPTIWLDGGNKVKIDIVEMIGAGFSAGPDIQATSTDYLEIDTLICDATPVIGGGGLGGVNIVVNRVIINGVLTASTLNPPATNVLNVSATDRILGRTSSGAGAVEEVTFTDQAQQLCDDTSFGAMLTTLGAAADSAVVHLSGTENITGTKTFAADLLRSGSSATTRSVRLQTAGVDRFNFGIDSITESGSDVGSDFFVWAWTDAGGSIGRAIGVTRANRYVEMIGVYNQTTASAANVFVDSSGNLMRSTSSEQYKKDIEPLSDAFVDPVLMAADESAIWYRSRCAADNPAWGWYGLSAEKLGQVAPQFVHWKTTRVEEWAEPVEKTREVEKTRAVKGADGEPVLEAFTETETFIENEPRRKIVPLDKPVAEGVAYERLVVPLIRKMLLMERQIERMGKALWDQE